MSFNMGENQEMQAMLAAIVESSDDAIIGKTLDGTILSWNGGAERLYGYRSDEIIGSSISILVPPGSHDDVPEILERVRQAQRVAGYETQRITKDGKIVDVSLTVSPIRDQSGNIIGASSIARDISAIKRRVEAVEEFDDQLRTTLESIGDGFFAVDGEWNLVYLNAVGEQLLGVDRDDVLEKNLWDAFPQTLGTNIETEYRKAAAGETRDFTDYYEASNRWFHHRCFPRQGGGMSVYFHDITEQKRAEIALRESEGRLRATFDNSALGIVEVDTEDHFTAVNDRVCQILGYSREELLTMNVHNLTYPEDRDRSDDMNARLHEGGFDIFDYEKRYLKRDGSPLWVHVTVSAIRDDDGRFVRGVGTVEDISERKKAEEALEAERARLRATLHAMPTGIWLADAHGRILETNEQAREIWGDTMPIPGSMGDYREYKGWWPDTGEPLTAEDWALSRSLTRGEFVVNEEVDIQRFDGAYATVLNNSAPIRDADDNIIGGVVMEMDITERKRAEEELKKAYMRLERMFSSNVVGMLIADTSGGISEANDYFIKMLGYTREDFENGQIRWDERTPEEYVSADQIALEELRTRGTCTPYEKEYIRKDGSRVWVLLADAILEGKDEQIIAFALDISDRKKTEVALRESEERFRDLADSMPQLVWTADTHGTVTYYNIRYKEYSGITELPDGSFQWAPVLHEDDVEPTVDAWQHSLETGEVYQIEHRVMRKDGDYRWHLSRGLPIKDDLGRIIKWYGTATDIEDTKAAQEEVKKLNTELEKRVIERTAELLDALEREQEAREQAEEGHAILEALMEYIPEGLTIADAPDVNIRMVSKYGQKLTGRPADVIEHIPVDEHAQKWGIYRLDEVTPATNEELPLTRATQMGEVVTDEEYILIRPDGARITILCNAGPIRDLNGNITGGIIAWRDITSRKQEERELTELKESLEQRTKELEDTNKELEAFSYSVSHDLRAPLRAIDGFSNTLLKRYHDSLDPQGQDYLDRVRAAAQRMAQLIEDILGLSRAGRAEIHRHRVDVTEMTLDVLRELRDSQPDRNADISIQPEVSAMADSHLLRIVLSNLLGNAWKFTSKKEVARIDVGSFNENGEQIYYVKDNGAGFNSERAEKLFMPFQRLHTESDFPGTGIGLALVQRIVRRHGGRIWAEGDVGSGATFYFTLGETDR